MNRIYYIKPYKTFKKVTFYSICAEGAPKNITQEFFERYEDDAELEESLNKMVFWLFEVGEKRGALRELFRDEDFAVALPPPRRFLAANEQADLRLYCIWLSESAVILLSGARKTADGAEYCPNCRPHFQFANKVAEKVFYYFEMGDFSLDRNGRLIFTNGDNTIEI